MQHIFQILFMALNYLMNHSQFAGRSTVVCHQTVQHVAQYTVHQLTCHVRIFTLGTGGSHG
jgi:hypothetical protein